ncbi:MAG: hypothetical protein CEE43_18635 [Promethearchaeota archaeon Loki_b32]|nr:MAG: hypothetical protein CEE43_18635 [Candidatus Lokiarchaeota archaeon Loki_b32]
MKKVKILTVFMVVAITLIPFATVSRTQSNGYVGVTQGSEYEWRIDLNLEGINNTMHNVEGLMTEIQTKISELDLFGLESKTLPEAMENISHTLLNTILPLGWEVLNISELLEETVEKFVEDFNSTFLNGYIPGDWRTLNYSTFMDYAIEGLNYTLPLGWEDHPIQHLIPLAINEFNNTILFGLIPDVWEQLTLDIFFESIITEAFPLATESFLTYLMMDQLLSAFYMEFPGSEGQVMKDLFPFMMPLEVFNTNLSTILDGLWYGINNTSPPGWESDSIIELLDYQADWMNGNLTLMDQTLDGANMSAILKWGIDMMMYSVNYSMPQDMFPPNWVNMTIQELAIFLVEQGKTQFTTSVLPQWDAMYEALETLGATIPTTLGIKVAIDNIGAEATSTLGGQRATEIEMTLFISIDMQTWMDFEELIGNLTSTLSLADPPPEEEFYIVPLAFLLNLTMEGYIVDPSSYSDPKIALLDQAVFTQCLIVATNYDWSTITTEATISAGGITNAFELSASWNSLGLLSKASLSSEGVTAISISLVTDDEIIPGYEITTLMIVMPLTVIGIIYYIRKRNK